MEFSNRDFETIDIEIRTDKAKEQEEAIVATTRGANVVVAKGADLGQRSKTVAPSILYNLLYFLNNGCLFVLRFSLDCF